MAKLYHWVPKNQVGNVLYPLNALKDALPDVHAFEVKKYAGREQVMQQRIPILNCLWNDVLHFTAVHPRDVKAALIEAGRDPNFTMMCYEIDPSTLNPKNTVVYLYEYRDHGEGMDSRNFVPFDASDLDRYSVLPEMTKRYYRASFERSERPLIYHKVPHILYRGTLDTSNLPMVTV